MKTTWQRIDDVAQRFFTPFVDIPVHALMVSGAQQALYAVVEKLHAEDLARVTRGQRPRNQRLIDWLHTEVDQMLKADDARSKATTA